MDDRAERPKSKDWLCKSLCGPECITRARKMRHGHIRNCESEEHEVNEHASYGRRSKIDLRAIEKLRS